MQKVTPWSLLIVFGGLSILLVGVNQATPENPTADATKFADSLFGSLGEFGGVIWMLVASALIAAWVFSSDSGGF